MDVERAKRYMDKINLIEERVDDLKLWTGNITIGKFIEDKKLRLASYKAFQEIVEASMDISSMIIRDSNLIVKDDYSNLSILQEKNVFPKEVIKALKEANGLRNRLVHAYNNLKDDMAFYSINKLLVYFEKFVEVVKKWLKERMK